MHESWTAVTWGEVAEKEIFKVATTSLIEQRVAGVLSAGRGMFDRGPVGALDTTYEFFHEVRSGQLVVRKLTTWEGPVTVVPPEFDGYVCSPEFPTFTLDANRLAPSYARLLCQQPDFWSQILAVSTGSVLRRKRVSPAALLSLSIVLPPLDEQRRIVDLVGSIDTYIDSLETQIETTRTARSALLSELLSNPGDDWQETTLGDVAVLEYGKALKEADRDGVGFPVFGSAGEVGRHSAALVAEGPVIIIGRKGTAGSVHWCPSPCSVIDTAYWVRIVEKKLRPDFAYLAISALQLPSLSAQTGVPGLNRDRAYSQPIGLPSAEEQRRIVDLVGSFDEQTLSLESQVESVRSFRSGVLSELLSGERLLDESYDVAVGL